MKAHYVGFSPKKSSTQRGFKTGSNNGIITASRAVAFLMAVADLNGGVKLSHLAAQ
jgi:hypothetical protein